MIILVETAAGANLHIARLYVDAWLTAGHKVIFWDDSQRSCYDIFYEIESQLGQIDLYFGHSWKLNKALINNLIARSYIKVILRADHYGDLDNIDTKQYPVGIVTDEQKKFVEILKKNLPNFKYMTSQYSQKEMERSGTHSKWANLGIEMIGMPLAANLTDYYYTKPIKENECQAVFCGGYWNYKSKYLSWMHNLTYPNITLKTKIFGNGWSGISCVGHANEDTVRKHYASSIINPCLYEPHSIEQYSDIPLRPFQISACHGFALSHNAIGLRELFTEDEIITFTNKKDFIEKALYYLNKPEERIPYMNKACLRTYKEHTNFHRSAKLLKLLGYQEESQQCLNIAEQKYNEVKDKINAIG